MSEPAQIYCGTYAKYNAGSIHGQWMDLEDYSDSESFLNACKELHKDESDPELMFQDFEGFPRSLYSESPDSEKLDRLFEWVKLSESDREIVGAYWEHSHECDPQEALDAYQGTFRTLEDWAADYVEQTGTLDGVSETVSQYFDYESFARDCELGGDIFTTEGGDGILVFSNT